MNKLVYLFELDSVRKTDREIELGQKALFDEIVMNGNTVVMTYNQLIDSRAFFSLLRDEKYYESLIRLFNSGAIRISQFEEKRTVTQYLIDSLDYDRDFIFSGWPLKSTQKLLLGLIKRSLTYSDLTEISGYINGSRTDEEISELFIELGSKGEEVQSSLGLDVCKNILENLFWLLKTVMTLSFVTTIYNSPKSSWKSMGLPKFIHNALLLEPAEEKELWRSAVKIIKALNAPPGGAAPVFDFDTSSGSNDRSAYHKAIRHMYHNADGAADTAAFQYAQAIIDICYNYQMEYSICCCSKHYNISEFDLNDAAERITFKSDFFSRLAQTWNIGDKDNRYLLSETNDFVPFCKPSSFPDFSMAVRMTEYAKTENPAENSGIPRYEFEIEAQKKQHKRQALTSIIKKICVCFVFVIIACVMEFVSEFTEELFGQWINFGTPVWGIIETLLFLFVSEAVSTLLSQKFTWLMSLSDALGSVGQLLTDAHHIMHNKTATYINPSDHELDKTEGFDPGRTIDFVRSDFLRRYAAMKKAEKNSKVFEESDVYPIADISDNSVIRKLLRLEELYNYRFGVVYKSKYNTVLADPIKDKAQSLKPYFSYERIIPSSGNGVVIVTKCRDKFILLKQYRHAPRKYQYCFPRGYGENGILSAENAQKELREEINAAEISQPIHIGKISPDSGLSSTCADVYLVNVESYSRPDSHEGIESVFAVTADEMENRIKECAEGKTDDFDDGFTLAAYLLYKMYTS